MSPAKILSHFFCEPGPDQSEYFLHSDHCNVGDYAICNA
jgi:hypothetical protein